MELYDYRCSQLAVLVVTVGVRGYGYDPRRSSLFIKCTDDAGKIVKKTQLTVSDDSVEFACCVRPNHYQGVGMGGGCRENTDLDLSPP